MSTVAGLLRLARAQLDAVDARLLLEHALERPHAWLAAHGEEEAGAEVETRFESLLARRVAGEPIAYILGRREFYGRDFMLGPGVLIPRPETELLLERGLAAIAGLQAPRLLELGCGSGCLAVSLALERPDAAVTAVDWAAAALECTRRNAERLGARLELLASDWFAALRGRSFELILSNPPYIAEGDTHLDQGDLRFEPRAALAAGADGLDAVRAIVAAAPGHLRPGGRLLVEHGYDQAPAVRVLLEQAGFREIEQWPDLAGILRVSGGRWYTA